MQQIMESRNIINGIPQKRERIYMVCFRKDLKISSFSFPKPITELCKKTENCYRTVARILKLYETMETDAIYQCLNQSGIAQSFVGKNAMFGFFALMNAVSAYDK